MKNRKITLCNKPCIYNNKNSNKIIIIKASITHATKGVIVHAWLNVLGSPITCLGYTVKLFYFMDTKFRGLATMDNVYVFRHLISWIQIILNIPRVNRQFEGILNTWIALPTKYTK